MASPCPTSAGPQSATRARTWSGLGFGFGNPNPNQVGLHRALTLIVAHLRAARLPADVRRETLARVRVRVRVRVRARVKVRVRVRVMVRVRVWDLPP